MPGKQEDAISTQLQQFPFVLEFLGLMVNTYATTFSTYTSKKYRTWVSARNWDDHVWSTAAELTGSFHAAEYVDCLLVVAARHLAKLLNEEPRLDTWAPKGEWGNGTQWADAYARSWMNTQEHGDTP